MSKKERFPVSDSIMRELGEIKTDSYLMFCFGSIFAFMSVAVIGWKKSQKKKYHKNSLPNYREV